MSFEIVHRIIYGFHMSLFFFIAGFFVHKWTMHSPNIAIKEKALRLIEPYFVWVIIVSVIKHLTASIQNNPISWKAAIQSPFVMFEEYWFIYTMFFIQIVYYLFARCKIKKFFIPFSICCFLLSPIIPNIWIFNLFSQFAIYFSLGTIYSPKVVKNIVNQKRFLIIACFLIVNIILVMFVVPLNNNIVDTYYLLLTSIFGIGFLSLIVIKIKAPMIQFLGQKSMEIFCIHPSISGILRVILIKLIGFRFFWTRTIIVTVLTIVICFVLFKIWPDNGFVYKTLFGGWKVRRHNVTVHAAK